MLHEPNGYGIPAAFSLYIGVSLVVYGYPPLGFRRRATSRRTLLSHAFDAICIEAFLMYYCMYTSGVTNHDYARAMLPSSHPNVYEDEILK